jgi:hypothetical protein
MVDMLLPPASDPTNNHDLTETLHALPDGVRVFWFLSEPNSRPQNPYEYTTLTILATGSTITAGDPVFELALTLGSSFNAEGVNSGLFNPGGNPDKDFALAQTIYNITLPKEMRPKNGERIYEIKCDLPRHCLFSGSQSLQQLSDGR